MLNRPVYVAAQGFLFCGVPQNNREWIVCDNNSFLFPTGYANLVILKRLKK